MNKLLRTALLLGVASIGIVSCSKKDEKKTPTPTPTPTPTNRYYFDFSLDGKSVKFASQEPQYMSLSYGVGGYQMPSSFVFFPSIGLEFNFEHSATDADVRALAGKRILFGYTWANKDSVTATLQYQEQAYEDEIYDNHDTSGAYYVDISKVAYSKRDTSIGVVLDVYEITGTCKARFSNDVTTKELTDGKFNMLVSRPLTDSEL